MLIGLPYLWTPIYRFPEPSPFNGEHFYNPYAELHGTWRRANLHAHGTEWGGLTNGQQPSADVVRAYRTLGYDIAGVSNYQSIAADDGVDTMPLYEHGYNVAKRHQLAIGAHRVEWFDFPLWQGLSHEQFVIDRVRATADLIGLTHPMSRDAYTDENLRHLTGYQLIEVVNGRFSAQEPWDVALSSGRVVWAMGNDDTHDISDPNRTAMAWNMIDAPTNRTADIIEALRAGRTYAVSRRDDAPQGSDTHVKDISFENGVLQVTTDGPVYDIEFIGQQGHQRRRDRWVPSARYEFRPGDTYIRTVIHTPRATLFLNPIIRYDGKALPSSAATIDGGMTWINRAALVAAFAVAAALLWPRTRPRQVRAQSTAPAALTSTDSEIA